MATTRALGTTDEALVHLLADRLAAGEPVRLRLGGHSMAPFIRDGDVATLEPLGARRPGLGEVVALSTADARLLVHRIVGWPERDRALTRGDVSVDSDALVGRDALLAAVTHVERAGRTVRLGLGRERVALACLSRLGLLRALARGRELVARVLRRRPSSLRSGAGGAQRSRPAG